MTIARSDIVEHLRSHGRSDVADRAERSLPDEVDPERDAELVGELGIDLDAVTDTASDHLAERTDPEGLRPYA